MPTTLMTILYKVFAYSIVLNMLVVVHAAVPAKQQEVVIGASKTVKYPLKFEDGSGLSLDLVNALNQLKSDFTFKHRTVSSMRLRHLIDSGLIDVASLHNIEWGWQENKVVKSHDLIKSGDRYIALKQPGRTQDFFSKLKDKTKLGLIGGQYRLVNNESSAATLERKYKMTLLKSEVDIINGILQGKAMIGVVSDTILDYMHETSKAYYDQLLISQQYDKEYSRHFLLSRKSHISVDKFNALLLKLKKTGKLDKIYAKYGLKAPKL